LFAWLLELVCLLGPVAWLLKSKVHRTTVISFSCSIIKKLCEIPFTMKSALFALVGLLAGTASAVELTPDNYDELTAGKTVFIKFLAPW